MTSVVDTSVKHFRSDMVGAPVLSGTAGAMIALLDACLVNGFDVKAGTSLVVAGGVATLSFSGTHSATVDSVILISGVTNMVALNGEQKITVIGAGLVKFATAAADGTAAGTISFKMAPTAYWTKPFSGTNLAVYKSTDPTGTGMSLRIDDTGTTSCRVVGYESMSDVNTGLGAFPTTAQISGGGYWAKSSLASAAAVLWVLIADGRKLILHIAPYYATSTANIAGVTRGFGDDIAYKPGGDAYACSLCYSITATLGSQGDGTPDATFALQHAMPRSYTALGSSVLHGAIPFTGGNTLSGVDATLGAFPSIIDGGLRLSRKWLGTASSAVPPRGELPGLYHVPMSAAFDTFKTRDVVSGTGALASRKLMALNPSMSYTGVPTSAATGASFVDITGPWR
jgi:hypothetical protein